MEDKRLIENRLWNDCTIELDLSDYESWDELRDYVEENNLCDEEVIYYANSIEYLSKEDPSLTESMEIAAECGYTPDNLNSEILASLLKSQKNREEFYSFESDIEEYYSDIE